MKAMRIHAFDGQASLVLEETPLPKINNDDVLIRVHAAAVNPIDWKVCAGTHPLAAKMELPLTPGWDVSGVIEAIGSDVTDFKVGDAVFAKPDHFRQGAYADYIAVRANEVALKPKNVSHVEAASLPLVALTTWQSFDAAQLGIGHVSTDQRVLIHGAAGGIGSFAVQLAKARGAYVIGTGSANNQEFILGLGADEYIDYSNTRFEEVLQASQKADVVYDTVGGDTQARSWSVLNEGGFLVSIVRPVPDEVIAAQHKVGSALIVVSPSGEQLSKVAELVETQHIKPIVSTVLPLADAIKAHELNMSGHTRGKIVLQVLSD